MRNLTWPEARQRAKFSGKLVRREGWKRWLVWSTYYIWFVWEPQREEPVGTIVPVRWDVVRNTDFTAEEFLANDWTDEHWDAPISGDTSSGGSGSPSSGGSEGGGSTGGTPEDEESEAEEEDDEEEDDEEISIPGGGVYGDSSSGSGGGGSGAGFVFPFPQPPQGIPPLPGRPGDEEDDEDPPVVDDAVVNVSISASYPGSPSPDGPGCWLNPPATCDIVVTVSITNGYRGVGVLSVDLPAVGEQLSTAHTGFRRQFLYEDVAWTPGSEQTVTVEYAEPQEVGPAVTRTGSATIKFDPECIVFEATFAGTLTDEKHCTHAGSPMVEDGYDATAEYTVEKSYCVCPLRAGETDPTRKTARAMPTATTPATPVIEWTTTPWPAGTPTTSYETPLAPPSTISVEVDGSDGVDNPEGPMSVFGPDRPSVAGPPCVITYSADESVIV